MADFVLTIADADVARVTAALNSTFNISYFHQGDPTVAPTDTVAGKAVLIQLLTAITVQVETAKAQAAIVPPVMS